MATSAHALARRQAAPVSAAANDAAIDAAIDALALPDQAGILRAHLAAHYQPLHRRLARRFGCPDLASESMHETWLRLADAVISNAIDSPEAYLYRMACNLAVDRLRLDRPWQYAADAEAELAQVRDRAPGPDLIAETRSDLAAVGRAIERLPRRHRAILVALRLDEQTREEVATRHGLSMRRIDTALRQALDYCAGQTGQAVMAGVRAPRRALARL